MRKEYIIENIVLLTKKREKNKMIIIGIIAALAIAVVALKAMGVW